jgi:hypothetical protein
MWMMQSLSSTPGIMTYTLPSDFSGLTTGQKYIWQVFLVCNPNSPSQSLVVGAAINIVEQPAEIVTELNNTSDAFQTGVGVGEAELGIANSQSHQETGYLCRSWFVVRCFS